LYLCWQHLSLPEPTPVQYDIGSYLQHGPKRSIIQAFRGVGKSWETSAFVPWSLLRNPQLKFLVISASKDRADAFSTFVKRLIAEMSILHHLKARQGQRDSNVAFDVGPSRAAHAPSVKSVGITGQIVGSRADIIIADDVEDLRNALTQTMRDKLKETVKEFDAVLTPGGRIIYLGTPHIEESLYVGLQEKGYECRIWPALKPDSRLENFYGDRLSPHIKSLDIPVGSPTDPKRFDSLDLEERKLSYGKASFYRQFMLDTSGEDALRYPLKLQDLLAIPLDVDKAPGRVLWARGEKDETLQAVGLSGDYWYKPFDVTKDYYEYTGSVMHIDPSGRGRDETGYCVTKFLNGMVFVTKFGGLPGGYDTPTLRKLANIAKEQKVNLVQIEPNFGDGMYNQIFKPVLNEVWKCTVEETPRAYKQKEERILDVLEPITSSHKLIFDYSEVIRDFEDTKDDPKRQLFYQLTRITREKGALQYDDRLDALAMGAAYWQELVQINIKEEYESQRQLAVEKGCKEFMESILDSQLDDERWVKI
jgi:hypothetical protein